MSRPTLLAIALLVALPLLASAEDRVYKWTDANGVVHYTQIEPDKVRSQARDIKVHTPEVAPPKPTPEDTACLRAKLSLDLLAKGTALVIDKDGDGQTERMTDEDRAAAKDLAERQVAAFCKTP
ncbi:DUF4124 domain-containing protein [Arenimonas oryziterrae]|uniref:DUF4124 domain-containing protein n=1 Tax=Arenimonas oryziterrae DSM 21050 = YC6267 TaxID=1121015 RepID=A0A091BGX1_9GAMM|nr:DUF4124 domain-containing protein [Arenimonas oryziterrae]KFN43625.1 hypothetical protein N789_10135 [Arenimonas oryziterrae DSM 21050 = YC6267]